MIEHPIGVVIAVGAILVFHGSVYALVALNTGWRFGYWITGASLFGLLFVMSLFWLVTANGPRGEDPHWIPLASDRQTISQATVQEQTMTSLPRYPGGDWESHDQEDDALFQERDAFRSSVGTCVDTRPDQLPESDREVCTALQTLLPSPESIPRVEGLRIVVTNEISQIRFVEENGVLLGQATVTPITRDPRYVEDPDQPQPVADPFLVAAYRDPGNVRTPSLRYLAASTLLLLLHLWGLSRAERKVLSPVVAL